MKEDEVETDREGIKKEGKKSENELRERFCGGRPARVNSQLARVAGPVSVLVPQSGPRLPQIRAKCARI